MSMLEQLNIMLIVQLFIDQVETKKMVQIH